MTLIPLRRTAAAAAVLSHSLALTACGGGEESGTDTATTSTNEPAPETPAPEATTDAEESAGDAVLAEDELSSALLTAADLPGGYLDDPSVDDEESDSFVDSCLQDISNLTDQPEFDADEEAEAAFVLDSAGGQSSIKSQVQSYADEQQIVSAIAMFSEVVGACTKASGTDPDGTSYDLRLQSDQTVSLTGVDEQARVAVAGTITVKGQELPVDIGFNVARIANNLITVSTLDIGEVGEGIVNQTDTTAQISVDRLGEITG